MDLLDIVLIGFGLAMDAFAVSVCKGLSMRRFDPKKGIIIAAYFGIFQAFMPVIGFFLGGTFRHFIESIDHWISFGLLLIIGVNMIKGAFSEDRSNVDDNVDVRTMITLAVATSIDALAIGVTFAFMEVDIFIAGLIIGVTTFVLSFIGTRIGYVLGNKLQKYAQITGGIILIVIGLRILLSHLGIIG